MKYQRFTVTLHHQVAQITGLENWSLWQRINLSDEVVGYKASIFLDKNRKLKILILISYKTLFSEKNDFIQVLLFRMISLSPTASGLQ